MFNESEKELAGKMVASVGQQEFFWTTLVVCNDKISSAATDLIFNPACSSSSDEEASPGKYNTRRDWNNGVWNRGERHGEEEADDVEGLLGGHPGSIPIF